MNIRRTQTLPQDWDDARDIPFFRVTTGLFSPAFCFGASVLLASNDDDSEAAQSHPVASGDGLDAFTCGEHGPRALVAEHHRWGEVERLS